MTNAQLNNAWDERDKPGSAVVWSQDGHGKDSDFMTIPFDGKPERTFERVAGTSDWSEVTTKPVTPQVSKS